MTLVNFGLQKIDGQKKSRNGEVIFAGNIAAEMTHVRSIAKKSAMAAAGFPHGGKFDTLPNMALSQISDVSAD